MRSPQKVAFVAALVAFVLTTAATSLLLTPNAGADPVREGPAPEGDRESQPPAEAPPARFSEVSAPGEPVRVDLVHDHTTDDARTYRFLVPEDSGPLDVAVFFEPPTDGGPCMAGSARLVVIEPDGQVFRDQTPATVARASGTCGGGLFQDGLLLDPGEWIVRFEGNGLAIGRVQVQTP